MAHTVPKIQWQLMAAVAVLAMIALIDAPYLNSAPLQTGPTFAILAAMIVALRKYPLPTAAITCVCIFLLLHTIGARYVYSNVPYDTWFTAIGLTGPSEFFGWERNHFDRLVHFSFGVLFVYPIFAILTLHFRVTTKRALYVAVEFIIAASALYEIFEWLLTLGLASADADAYNGQQGDMWDAQKDMALASLGALIAAIWIYAKRPKPELMD